MVLIKKNIKKRITAVLVIAILVAFMPCTTRVANAASLVALSDTMSNQTQNALSSHIIKFTTPTGVTGTGQTIVVTFPSGFDFTSKSISTLSLSYGATGTEISATIAAAPSSSTVWGAVFSGSNNTILTLTAPTSGIYIAPSNKVILTYDATNAVNPASPASYTIDIAANGDTGSVTVPIIANSQVAVSATVAASLSFSLSSSSIGFGTITSSATQYATAAGTGTNSEPANAHTISASTNGATGYVITLSGSTLTSGLNSIAAIPGATAAPLTPGTPQFGIRTTTSGGTGTVNAPFNGTAGNYGFGTSPLVTQPFASAPGTTTTTIYNVNYAANISTATPTGSYTTSLIYAATANF